MLKSRIMAHTVSVKLAGKVGRIRLEGTDLESKVSDFREKVTSAIGKQELPDKFNLVYCGKLLSDDSTLTESGVKPGSTIHILRKREPEDEPKIDPMDETDIRQLMTALHAALLNPSHRQAVHKILTSTETIDNIIAATPGMSADHIAVSMLRDPQLLVQVADPENVRSIVREHPAIGHAVMNIAASVNEEAAHSARTGSGLAAQDGAFGFLPDFVTDDDMDTSEAGSSRAAGGSSGITAAQLSAALNVAGVGRVPGSGTSQPTFLRPYESSSASASPGIAPPPPPAASGGTPSQNPPGGNASGVITADLFQQALAQAIQTSQPGTSSGTSNSNTEQDFTAQLKQLRDMGITDDEVSLRALKATNGNVDAALHLIFEEKHMT